MSRCAPDVRKYQGKEVFAKTLRLSLDPVDTISIFFFFHRQHFRLDNSSLSEYLCLVGGWAALLFSTPQMSLASLPSITHKSSQLKIPPDSINYPLGSQPPAKKKKRTTGYKINQGRPVQKFRNNQKSVNVISTTPPQDTVISSLIIHSVSALDAGDSELGKPVLLPSEMLQLRRRVRRVSKWNRKSYRECGK